jgi:hypothetical protein
MSPLRAFLAEVKADRRVQKVLAADTIIDGKPAAEHLAEMEYFFDRLESDTGEMAIEAYDAAISLLRARASWPLKQRLETIAGCRLLS